MAQAVALLTFAQEVPGSILIRDTDILMRFFMGVLIPSGSCPGSTSNGHARFLTDPSQFIIHKLS